MVDVGALRAGMSVGGAVPAARQAVEPGLADTPPVEHRHLSLQNMRAAVEREAVVGLLSRSDDVGGDYPDAVDRLFAPVRDDDKRVVDNAVAAVGNMEVDRLVVALGTERDAIEDHRQVFERNGVVLPMAVGTSDEVYLPESVAPRFGPICGVIIRAGALHLVLPEGIVALAQADGNQRVVVVVEP